jgi:hypothetical protein
MKKVFLMLAFAGLVGSVSASVKTAGDGDKDKTKKECKKDGKCCKDKAAEGKSCSADAKTGEKKACCKDKKAAETKTTETK